MKTVVWLMVQCPILLWLDGFVIPWALTIHWKAAIAVFFAVLVISVVVTKTVAANDRLDEQIKRELTKTIVLGGTFLLVWSGSYPVYSISIPGMALYGTLVWRVRNSRLL